MFMANYALNNEIQELTFEKIILRFQGMATDQNALPDRVLKPIFCQLFFDVSSNSYTNSCFKDYSFLRKSVHTVNGKIYYTDSNASNCILAKFGFDSEKLYNLIFNVEKYFKDRPEERDGQKALLRYYNDNYIDSMCDNISNYYITKALNKNDEASLISDFWNFYKTAKADLNLNLATSLLILYSVLNASVIHLIPYLEKTIQYNHKAIRDVDDLINGKFVICSALSLNLFLAHLSSNEILSEDDQNQIDERIMLFTAPKNKLNLDNAIFKFELADPNDRDVEPDDKKMGGLMVEIVDKPLHKVIRTLLGVGALFEEAVFNRRNKDRYYIKAIIGEEEYYMQYIDWYKNSKIVFNKEKNKKSSWYIEKKNSGFKISPYGTTQYHLFSLDIPNATTKTFNIPLWLFPGNKTKAQRFIFYRIVE